ncbi:MAG TPA: divergent polysaccharide deacetylase family protein [Gammaproteobacteria bacterium]|nr:divergent polysaccharide deacetylase family protein [Gammaproteobacteria bacterium]
MHLHPAIWRSVCALWLAGAVLSSIAYADGTPAVDSQRPAIAIIIDDMGNQRREGLRVINLPAPVACAFLPYSAFSDSLAREAHTRQKEVMLHLPMQAMAHEQGNRQQGMLTLDMTRQQFLGEFRHAIDAVPHASGLNNHMGSLLTRHPGSMAWLMQAISDHGDLFFVDSRTTRSTVAEQLALEHGIPTMARKVFLDNVAETAAVRAQFRLLLAHARRDGTALGIGHPHPATLQVLEEELAHLDEQGIQLLPVASLINRHTRRRSTWQASLSR